MKICGAGLTVNWSGLARVRVPVPECCVGGICWKPLLYPGMDVVSWEEPLEQLQNVKLAVQVVATTLPQDSNDSLGLVGKFRPSD
jgi:hypothetical protein